jgi:hypothetical protein
LVGSIVEAEDRETGYLATKVAKVEGHYVKLAGAATGGDDVLTVLSG